MAGSRTVQARARLRERLIAQEAALSAASRLAAGVQSAKDRQRALVEQGERLVEQAESNYLAAVAELSRAMGSPQLAALVLDVKPAVVRKAVADRTTLRAATCAKAAAGRGAHSPLVPTATAAS
jgi:hypothetical protein